MKVKLLVSLLSLLLCAREASVDAAQLPPSGDPAAPAQIPPKVPPQQPFVVPTPPKVAPQQPAVPIVPGAPGAPVPPVLPGRARQPIVPPQGQPGGPIAPPQFSTTPRIAPPPTIPSGGMVSLNFTRADLVEIIHIIAQHLRLTYTIDPEVKGTVTINSAEPLRSEDLMPIFHQILRMNGAVAVRTGNLYHITTLKDGKGLARPVTQGREDSFALQIVPVRFFTVAEMKRVLQPFTMPGGELIENPRGNFLVIVDTPSNIQRLVEIADLIDVQIFAGTRMEIYQPKVASAEELSQEMTKLMQSFASSASQADSFTAQFIPLPRINQLLVIAHSEAAWTYARRWLERIDVVAEGPGRRIFIYPVENGKATELADVLSQALGLSATASRGQSPTLQNLHRSTAGASNQPSGLGSGSSSFGQSGSSQQRTGSAFATIPLPGQPANPVAPTPPAIGMQQPGIQRPQTSGQPAAKAEEQLRIVADTGTNSLIIYGTVQEFQNIKNILQQLDAIPRQVLLDVLVAEVTLSDNQSLGVDYEILGRNSSTIFGQRYGSSGALRTLGSLFPTTSGFGTSNSLATGLSGVFGGGDIKAIVNALQGDARFKVLSSPSILATDNKPARIQVGTEEPIATGTISQAVGGVANSTSIQYRNTGRIVTIIPQVNSMGLVNLQILAEVSQRRTQPVQVGQDPFPAFDTRQAETTAVVQDGDTLAIGGIITDSKNRTRTGIPYLMDLPIFGRFFGTSTDEISRTELIMLITPHVIRNRDESRSVTEDFKSKLNTVRNELEKMRYDRDRDLERQRRLREPFAPVQEQMPEGEIQVPPAPAEQKTPVPPAPSPARVQPSGTPVTPPKQATNVIQPPPVVPVNPQPPVPAKGPGMFPPKVSQSQPVPVEFAPAQQAQAASEPLPATSMVAEPVVLANVPQAEVPPEPAAAPITPPSDGVALLLNRIEARAVPEVKAEPAQPRISQGPVWVVQVASYANEADAKNFAGKLRSKGYDANISAADIGGKARYRVEVGHLPTRNQALALQKELRSSQRIEDSLVLSKIAPLNP